MRPIFTFVSIRELGLNKTRCQSSLAFHYSPSLLFFTLAFLLFRTFSLLFRSTTHLRLFSGESSSSHILRWIFNLSDQVVTGFLLAVVSVSATVMARPEFDSSGESSMSSSEGSVLSRGLQRGLTRDLVEVRAPDDEPGPSGLTRPDVELDEGLVGDDWSSEEGEPPVYGPYSGKLNYRSVERDWE